MYIFSQKNDDVRVYSVVMNFTEFHVFWKPVEPELAYSRDIYTSGVIGLSDCPQLVVPGHCYFDDYRLGETLIIVFFTGDAIVKELEVNTSEHFRPHPISLSSINTNIKSRTINFNVVYATKGVDLVLRINITSTDSKITQNMLLYFEHFDQSLSGLYPYTNYRVDLAVKPTPLGYWSDPTVLNLRTKEDIPSESPMIRNSAFVVKRKGNITDYTIFWQEIPTVSQNGVILKYEGFRIEEESTDILFITLPKQRYSTVGLRHESNKICLKASTKLGTSMCTPESIITLPSRIPTIKAFVFLGSLSTNYISILVEFETLSKY